VPNDEARDMVVAGLQLEGWQVYAFFAGIAILVIGVGYIIYCYCCGGKGRKK